MLPCHSTINYDSYHVLRALLRLKMAEFGARLGDPLLAILDVVYECGMRCV